MLKALVHDLQTHRLLQHDETVVVGVSGGPDSTALLHLLTELNKDPDWDLKLHVAHLNHQLRTEDAEKDSAFVQALADGLGLPCSIDSRDIREVAERGGTGVEEAGRQERYAFFERVCLKAGATVIALGHHADDNAETILQRIIRGTGIRGLGGIRPSRPLDPGSRIRVIRPLLRFTHEQLRTYLVDAGITFREDHSNAGAEPMRNRIRNKVIPLLAAEANPQVRDALTRLGEQAQWVEEYLRETVERTFDTLIISRTDQELALNADALARKSRIVQTEIIRLAYRSFGLGEQDLSFANLVSALELISVPGSGKRVVLPGGMNIVKRYHQLFFSLPSDEPRETIAPEIAVHVPGKTVLPIRRLEIECTIVDVNPGEPVPWRKRANHLEEFADFQALTLPLVVRPRRPGDRFVPLGAPGSKKLSDFLIDAKVDPRERQKVAVLCDHLGPIWVIGYRIDDRVKTTALTRQVLRMRARRLES